MTAVIALAVIALAAMLVLAPMTAGTAEPVGTYGSGPSDCSSATWTHPPTRVRVKRIHHRGSSVPVRIQSIPIDTYVERVMASGAWGNRVWESAKVGSVMIRQYVIWMVLRTCRSWHGRRFDITDSEMYYRDVKVPARTARIVRIMRSISLVKNGHHLRLGWSGDGGRCGQVVDGYHVGEDGVRDCAERLHYGWRRILRLYLSPRLSIRGDWR